LTRTFNPKVPGSRPGRPTSTQAINGCIAPSQNPRSQHSSQLWLGLGRGEGPSDGWQFDEATRQSTGCF
jgi:hypothetical protein